MNQPRLVLVAIGMICVSFAGCGSTRPAQARYCRTDLGRVAWATPLDCSGVPNLHQVDDRLFRGGQPTAEGFQALERLGVHTIINVRSDGSDRPLLAGTSLRCVEIRTTAGSMSGRDLARFLAVVNDPASGVCFVHCHYGADRTGAMCAAYRVAVNGWGNADALAEMREGGFNFHEVCVGLPPLVRGLDRTELRNLAGLEPHVPPMAMGGASR